MTTTGVIDRSGLDDLIHALTTRGYTTVGPTVRDGAIVYDVVTGTADLPVGWTDRQGPGEYALAQRNDERLFGYVVGPHSWKRFLYPAHTVIWAGERNGATWDDLPPAVPPSYAFLGVRACEIAAMRIQDRVFLGEDRPADSTYAGRREAAFIIGVDCDEPGGTCFCTSMGTGPAVTEGYDLALTELPGDEPTYLVEVGSERGAEVLADVTAAEASAADRERRNEMMNRATDAMAGGFDPDGVHDLLLANLEHPHWERVAERCLGCTNCTFVCPTCFCATVEDTLSLDGTTAERTRHWDSCFTMDFSYIHGGPMRPSRSARYRQWLTHKLATWVDQFGSYGCVGCGRCISWCPVGIDLRSEVEVIRVSDLRLGVPTRNAGVRP